MEITKELMRACDRLIFAAQRRDNSMGDPINLITNRAELRDAAEAARAVVAKARAQGIKP